MALTTTAEPRPGAAPAAANQPGAVPRTQPGAVPPTQPGAVPPARAGRWARVPEQWRLVGVAAVVLCSPSLALGLVVAAHGGTRTVSLAPIDDTSWADGLFAGQAAPGSTDLASADPMQPVLPMDGDVTRLSAVGQPGAEEVPPAGLSTTVSSASSLTPAERSQLSGLTRSGIPVRAVQAYVRAQQLMERDRPSCGIRWSLIAGIGRVESNHGRFGGASYGADGRVGPPILGPRLDGSHPGWATIHDSDGGRYNGDAAFDRAVGPMQFLPGTWRTAGADADGDGVADPQDLDDAAYGTARYLCSGGGDLTTVEGQRNAVYRYNRSTSYGTLVLRLAAAYERGQAATVSGPSPTGAPTTAPTTSATGWPSASARPTPTPTPAGTRPSPTGSHPTPTATPTAAPTGWPTTSIPSTSAPDTPEPLPTTPIEQPTTLEPLVTEAG